MNIKTMLAGMAALLLFATNAPCQSLKKATEAESRAMVAKIGQRAGAINSLSCDFTQVKTLRFLDDKMTSRGRMYYSGGDKLRWEYTAPYTYTFILNGQKVFLRPGSGGGQTIDLRQSRLFQGIARVMMNSVTGKGLATADDFACTMYTQGEEWVAVLVPQKKEMKKLFKDVRLHFGSRQQMVTRVELSEQNGDTTVISLSGVKTNQRIDEKVFATR